MENKLQFCFQVKLTFETQAVFRKVHGVKNWRNIKIRSNCCCARQLFTILNIPNKDTDNSGLNELQITVLKFELEVKRNTTVFQSFYSGVFSGIWLRITSHQTPAWLGVILLQRADGWKCSGRMWVNNHINSTCMTVYSGSRCWRVNY